MPKNEDLLEEIRDTFDIYVREWADIRQGRRDDMKMIADGPWSEQERRERLAADRVCLTFDELGQYLNQTIGDMRQNKRAIKVTPKGNGADDTTALKRAGIIREIEYQSNAQVAYMTAFDNMIKGSYGYFKLGTRYANPDSGMDQELYLAAIPNPDTIYLDPFAKNPDWSDMKRAFEIDHYSEKEFKAKWPDAEIASFDENAMATAPNWIGSNRIQVAAYWRVEEKKRRLLLIDGQDPHGPTEIHLDELPKGSKVDGNRVIIGGVHAFPLLNQRKTVKNTVVQYITNGIEILETNPQQWDEIPIVAMFGPEEYVDDGSGSKRRILSMVRKARDAYMAYCYTRTAAIETIGMVPKVIYMGYEGQFDTKTPWDEINKIGRPYGEVKAKTTATGNEVLPLPTRQPYDPPVQSLEIAAAAFKQAIMAAVVGTGGMLNGSRSQNLDARSGKAMDAVDRQESQNTFVYVSSLERGIERAGRLAEKALVWCYDTPREVGSRSPSDEYSTEKINQTQPDAEGNPVPVGFHTATGDHGVTLGVGPSDQSNRDRADDFVDTLVNIKGIPPKILALAVKLKNLGPIGDEIAEAFDPTGAAPPLPPQVQQHMAQSDQIVQQLTATVHALQNKLDAKIPEIESKERMHAADLDFKREQLRVEASIGAAKIGSSEAIAQLNIETDIIAKERGMSADAIAQESEQAHEAALQDSQQQHQAGLAQQGQAADAAAQASDQIHQTQQAQQAQDAAAEQPESE